MRLPASLRHALAALLGMACCAPLPVLAQEAYLRDSQGKLVRSSSFGNTQIGSLCWRGGAWTPAQAIRECEMDVGLPESPPPPPAKRAEAPSRARDTMVQEYPWPVTLDRRMYFDNGTIALTPPTRATLDELLDKMRFLAIRTVLVIGHADKSGNSAANHALSMRRAQAVKAYLVAHGIAPDLVHVEGKGDTQPIADDSTPEGRAKNRYVDLEVAGTSK